MNFKSSMNRRRLTIVLSLSVLYLVFTFLTPLIEEKKIFKKQDWQKTASLKHAFYILIFPMLPAAFKICDHFFLLKYENTWYTFYNLIIQLLTQFSFPYDCDWSIWMLIWLFLLLSLMCVIVILNIVSVISKFVLSWDFSRKD